MAEDRKPLVDRHSFSYTNRGPSPYNVVLTHLIVIRLDGDDVVWERHYGEHEKPNPITDRMSLRGTHVDRLVRKIYRGCCGRDEYGCRLLVLKANVMFALEMLGVKLEEERVCE